MIKLNTNVGSSLMSKIIAMGAALSTTAGGCVPKLFGAVPTALRNLPKNEHGRVLIAGGVLGSAARERYYAAKDGSMRRHNPKIPWRIRRAARRAETALRKVLLAERFPDEAAPWKHRSHSF